MQDFLKMVFIAVVGTSMVITGFYLVLLLFFSHALWPNPEDAKYFVDRDLGWTAGSFTLSLILWLAWGSKWAQEQ